ncbi:hypothetical protein H9Y05_11310 [Crocinitomicaceae bacterium CZZ-1]|uniref:Uncharacterized protein n=1 Tax=Taishania pollutisoli TaxID=2766479 RepID=A0A8J6TTG0_9FLAO|nr:hypothetical protein [Taishania pollutisoli]MBC9813057.1 hypothetical protein [Taishania pollutisoli]
MKILLTLFMFMTGLCATATHELTYYVYSETEYIQGPWLRTDALEASGFKFLSATSYEDLFGSGDDALAGKLLSRLKEKKPDLYEWNYTLSFQGDTVIITPQKTIQSFETVMNEITATLTLNRFKAVTFQINGQQKTYTLTDLTLPYFDLVSGQPETSGEPEIVSAEQTQDPVKPQRNQRTWLIISGVLNVIFLGVLIMRKKN